MNEIATMQERIITAIASGTDIPAMHEQLKSMETEREQLIHQLKQGMDDNLIHFHPNMADRYKNMLDNFQSAFDHDDSLKHDAKVQIRNLIDKVVIAPGEKKGETLIDMHGRLAALLDNGLENKQDGNMSLARRVSVVAVERFELPTQGL